MHYTKVSCHFTESMAEKFVGGGVQLYYNFSLLFASREKILPDANISGMSTLYSP